MRKRITASRSKPLFPSRRFVCRAFFTMEDREVETSAIGELVMQKLKQLDEVAYVRFASVYREFKDVNTFMEELGKLLENKRK